MICFVGFSIIVSHTNPAKSAAKGNPQLFTPKQERYITENWLRWKWFFCNDLIAPGPNRAGYCLDICSRKIKKDLPCHGNKFWCEMFLILRSGFIEYRQPGFGNLFHGNKQRRQIPIVGIIQNRKPRSRDKKPCG